MSDEARRRWEDRHRKVSTAEARPSMRWLPRAAVGGAVALDVACGQGRQALALLAAGYDVVGVDIARTALEHALRRCTGARGRFLPVAADVSRWPFARSSFDVVVQIDFLDRRVIDPLKGSVQPGGLCLIDTFRISGECAGHRPSNPDYLLRDGELERIFDDWEILESSIVTSPVPRAAVLARRPPAARLL